MHLAGCVSTPPTPHTPPARGDPTRATLADAMYPPLACRPRLALVVALLVFACSPPGGPVRLVHAQRASAGRGAPAVGGAARRAAQPRASVPGAATRARIPTPSAARGGPRAIPNPAARASARPLPAAQRGAPRQLPNNPNPRPVPSAARAIPRPALRGDPRALESATPRPAVPRAAVPDAGRRPSEPRDPSTVLRRAVEDQSRRVDELQGVVDEALRRDGWNAGLGVGVGLGLGYGAGYYDAGYYGAGYYDPAFGLGYFPGGGWSAFADPCCASGVATAAAYCSPGGAWGVGVWGAGLNAPCCVNGGGYLCDAAALAAQSTFDRRYPEPCCSSGYAVRGDFCSSRFDQTGDAKFPCCLEGEYVCAPNSSAETKANRAAGDGEGNRHYPNQKPTPKPSPDPGDGDVREATRPTTRAAGPSTNPGDDDAGAPSRDSNPGAIPPVSGGLRLTSAMMNGAWVARDEDDVTVDPPRSDECALELRVDDDASEIRAAPTNPRNASHDDDSHSTPESESTRDDDAVARCGVTLVTGKILAPGSAGLATAFVATDGDAVPRRGVVRIVPASGGGGAALAIAWEREDEEDGDGTERGGAYAPVWVKVS